MLKVVHDEAEPNEASDSVLDEIVREARRHARRRRAGRAMGEQHANGWRVSRHRLVADVIANPMSGPDIRRLVASASEFPNAEKASMVVRLTGYAFAQPLTRVTIVIC